MPRKKVARTRSNYMENTTDGVRLVAGLQPITTVAYPSSSPKLMLQRKRSVNVNHLHSYHTEGSAPPDAGVMLNLFHSDHADPSPSHLLALNLEHTSPNLSRTKSCHPVHTTGLEQFISSLGLAEMCVDSNQTNNHYSDPSIDQNLYPVSFAERSTYSKLLDSSMSGVRSAERSMDYLNVLHSYHSDPSASQSMSVRPAERSIEPNMPHSYHSDAPASQSMSVRSPERSIESNELQNSLLNTKTSPQVTSFNPTMSDVHPAERSIELSQLYSYHFYPSASNLHPACLSKGSTDSKVSENNYSIGTNWKF